MAQVWDLYGRRRLLAAVLKPCEEFNEEEVEISIVGLWCALPDIEGVDDIGNKAMELQN